MYCGTPVSTPWNSVSAGPTRSEPLGHFLHRLAQFDFGGVIQRVLILLAAAFHRRKLEQLETVERPAMRRGDGAQLLFGLRQRHIQADLALQPSLEQELHRERRLPGPGIALD